MNGLPPVVGQTDLTGFMRRDRLRDASKGVYWQALCLGRNDRGLMLLAPDGIILAINEAGKAIIETSGILFTLRQRLSCRATQDQAAFRKILGELGSGTRHAGVMRFEENVVMTLDRLFIPESDSNAVLAAVYSEFGYSSAAVSRWQHIFGLSPAEAWVGEYMRHGVDDPTIARKLGLALNTVRSYAKSVRSKTGTRSRAELAHLLSRIVVL